MNVSLNSRWENLCQASVERFGHKLAWVYPFMRLNPFAKDAPIVQTAIGPAYILGTVDRAVEVVTVRDRNAFRQAELTHPKRVAAAKDEGKAAPKPPLLVAERLPVHQIGYPTTPPPAWQESAYGFLQSLAVTSAVWISLFAVGVWVFP